MSQTTARTLARHGLHLAVLSAFAVAQPLFDLLSKTPEFFVARHATGADVVAFAVAVVVLPPAALLALEALAALISRRALMIVHGIAVTLLSALLAMQVLRRLGDVWPPLHFALALVVGAAVAFAVVRTAVARLFVTVLSPAPLVFCALFLFSSPLAKLEEEAHAKPLDVTASAPPVVLVVFDELPTASLMDANRRIDAGRYPNFAALARTSRWYRNAMTVHEHSTEAVPAILTGRYPESGQLPLVADHPDNVFTLLGARYAVHVQESITQLCPRRVCRRHGPTLGERLRALADDLSIVYAHLVAPKRLEQRLPSVSDTWEGFRDDDHGDGTGEQRGPLVVGDSDDVDRHIGRELWQDQRRLFDRFVAGVKPAPEPSLHVVHSLLPHYPWRYLPSGRKYGQSHGIEGLEQDVWDDDAWVVAHAWQRHLLQVGFTDRLLGRLVARLKSTGVWDRALVVVTADHGTSFRPGVHRRSIELDNIGDIAPVPLFVKLPHSRRGSIDDRVAETVDILPTIADVLDIPLPWHADGHSLVVDAPTRAHVVVRERGSPRSVVAPVARVLAQRDETLRRQVALLGGGDWDGVYRVAPRPALLGRSVAAFAARAAGGTVTLDGASLLGDVDLASGLSPSHLTGRVSVPDSHGPFDLAIAVNGRIAAVTRTFTAEGVTRFASFAPERAFRDGRNDVDVFLVAREGRAVRLERLRGGTSDYALSDAGTEIVGGGRTIRVVDDAVAGFVEDWFYEPSTVRFGGWAADVRRRRLADAVLVFAGERLVYVGATTVERRSIGATRDDPRLARAGFAFELPRELVREGAAGLRFFAVSGDVASELPHPRDFPWRPRG